MLRTYEHHNSTPSDHHINVTNVKAACTWSPGTWPLVGAHCWGRTYTEGYFLFMAVLKMNNWLSVPTALQNRLGGWVMVISRSLIIWLGAQIKWVFYSRIQLYSILKFSSCHLIQFTMIERRICKITIFCLTVIALHKICTICHAWFNFNCVHMSLISCNFGLLCCHYGLHEPQIHCQINFAKILQCPTLKSVTGYYFLSFIIFQLFWSYNYMLLPPPTP